MRYSKLYASEAGTILAIEESEGAEALVRDVDLPRVMFAGRSIPAHVAQADSAHSAHRRARIHSSQCQCLLDCV